MRAKPSILKTCLSMSRNKAQMSQNNAIGKPPKAGLNRIIVSVKRDKGEMYPVHASGKREIVPVKPDKGGMCRIKASGKQIKATVCQVRTPRKRAMAPGQRCRTCLNKRRTPRKRAGEEMKPLWFRWTRQAHPLFVNDKREKRSSLPRIKTSGARRGVF